MAETRTLQQTHPWIRFQLDLRNTDYTLWFQLGEAQARCQQIVGMPLLPDVADYLHQVFLAKGALATTAIEVNTLSEEDALELVKGELDLPPSKEYLGQEIKNIVNACNMVADTVLSGELTELTLEGIRELNTHVLHNLPLREDVSPGQIREYDVGVGLYRGAPPQDCEFLLKQLCSWLNGESFLPGKERRIASGTLKAIVAHLIYGLDPSVRRWKWAHRAVDRVSVPAVQRHSDGSGASVQQSLQPDPHGVLQAA